MRNLLNALRRLTRDERGGETLEYVLIGGLIVIGAIATIAAVGTKVVARWTSVDNSAL